MLGAARPVEGEPFLSRRPHFRGSVVLGLFGVGGARGARGRAAHLYPPRCLSRRGPSFAAFSDLRLARVDGVEPRRRRRARRGISRVGVAGGVGGGRAPNSLLAGFPQLHVRCARWPRGETRQKHSDPLASLSCSAAGWQTPIAQTLGRGRDNAS